VVWTSTELMSHKRPTYDAATGRWTLLVLRNNAPVTLNPAHIVLATSMYGAPRMPVVPHAKVFPGRVIHAHTYQDAAGFAAQRVLVVGSANTGADICGDLVGAGARVTMLQRGPTSVIFSRALRALYDAAMPFGAPSDVVDFLGFAMPTRLREHLTRTARKATLLDGRDPDGSHADDLRRKQAMVERGYLFSDGPDGTGIAGELNKRFAGHRE
jgi:cation diffusion facilitator CzcD-associated flavoprotein CzcO